MKNKNADLRYISNRDHPVKRVRDKRSKMFDKGGEDALKHQRGRQSLVEKLKRAGVFYDVLADTRKFKIDNPNSGYMDTYHYLSSKYPDYFTEPKDYRYCSNFSLQINSDPLWTQAYNASRGDLLNKVELRMSQLLSKDNVSDANIIKAYEVINKVQAEKDSMVSNTDNIIEVVFE